MGEVKGGKSPLPGDPIRHVIVRSGEMIFDNELLYPLCRCDWQLCNTICTTKYNTMVVPNIFRQTGQRPHPEHPLDSPPDETHRVGVFAYLR